MTAEINKGPMLGQRHMQSFLLFSAIVVNFLTKFNAGVAVVAMTDAESSNPDFPEYDWNEMERSYILSSFFWGYILTQFLGGWLCKRYGARITMFVSTLGSSVLVVLVPWCVSWGGWQAYCALRMAMGLFQGFVFPCIHAHLANWCPVNERNRLGALANMGIDVGTLVAMFASGLIAASSIGWPGIFYVSCGSGVFWCILWWIFGADTPSKCNFISEAEKNYIETSIRSTHKAQGASSSEIPVPWKAIWTSIPFWAYMITKCCQSWGFSTLQTEMPAYMNGVLLMDMKKNALYSALPYLASWIMAFVYLIIADILLTRGIMSITGIRKTINSIAFFVPAAALIGVGFLDSDQKTLAVVLMCANVGVNAGSTIGSTINTIDLSPNHAGILMGIANTASNVIPIITPILVGLMVKDSHDRQQWQTVFIISAVVFVVGDLIYLAFGQMVSQPWDAPDFLDNQRSSKLQEEGNSKALESKQSEKLEEANLSGKSEEEQQNDKLQEVKLKDINSETPSEKL
ncbi:putative inorganic phosphate cotransporter [Drosophila eugracilis]|uniref:putative inorganic phosphate cotransporter n=1 Tax=Drosophila eugracilis TaxID=29029 RepID=UPI0007E82CA9|nr:putative inorganic phosphate cotransporter [Drosophila eugracilis]